MKTVFVFAFVISIYSNAISNTILSQHFIGLHQNDIALIVKDKYNSLKLNTGYINNSYNYLKYEDGIREITVLFFLNDNNNCRMIRIMSDYSNLSDYMQDLKLYYTKTGKNTWEYTYESRKYTVELEEKDWFFSITIKESKN